MVVVVDTVSATPLRPRHPEKVNRPDALVAAEAGLDPGARAEHARLCRHPQDRQGKRPRHGVRGGGLPEHRRVLGQEARHLHDHGRHLHPRLRLLQRQDRHARRARCAGAGARRGSHLQARARPYRHHLGGSRRPRRWRRRTFRANHPRDPRALPGHDHRDPDAGFPAQGRRARSRGGGKARRVQPQSGNGAVALSHGAPGRALFPFDPAVAAGQGNRSRHLHQIRHHGRARRGASRGVAGDGRPALGGCRFSHHRAISAADPQASRRDALCAAG